jgi:hypothetical protein
MCVSHPVSGATGARCGVSYHTNSDIYLTCIYRDAGVALCMGGVTRNSPHSTSSSCSCLPARPFASPLPACPTDA